MAGAVNRELWTFQERIERKQRFGTLISLGRATRCDANLHRQILWLVFVAGAALCELRGALLIAGASLCEPQSGGAAFCAAPPLIRVPLLRLYYHYKDSQIYQNHVPNDCCCCCSLGRMSDFAARGSYVPNLSFLFGVG